jgi:hypothetical protein
MRLTFEFTRMPHTSEMWNLARGFEDLYYSLLFTTDDAYNGRDDVWQSWLAMGLDLGIREAPPAAVHADRIKTIVRSAGKIMEVTVRGGRVDLTDRVWSLVEAMVAAPGSVKALGAAERAATLTQQGPLRSVVDEVSGAQQRGNLLERSADVFRAAIDRDVAAFSYPNIVGVSRNSV